MKRLIFFLLLLANGCAWGQPIVRSPWTTQTTPNNGAATSPTFTTPAITGRATLTPVGNGPGYDIPAGGGYTGTFATWSVGGVTEFSSDWTGSVFAGLQFVVPASGGTFAWLGQAFENSSGNGKINLTGAGGNNDFKSLTLGPEDATHAALFETNHNPPTIEIKTGTGDNYVNLIASNLTANTAGNTIVLSNNVITSTNVGSTTSFILGTSSPRLRFYDGGSGAGAIMDLNDGAATFLFGVTAQSFTGSGSGLTALNAGNLSSGVAPVARLGTGSGSATTFLNGTGAFTTPAGAPAHTLQSIWIFTGPRLGLTNSAGFISILGTNGVGSKTITSAMISAGSTLRVTIMGHVQNSGGGNAVCNALLDGTTVVGTSVWNPGAIPAADLFQATIRITFQTTGASGTVVGDMVLRNESPAANNVISVIGANPVTVDTTVSHVFEVIFSPAAQVQNFVYVDQAMVDYTP